MKFQTGFAYLAFLFCFVIAPANSAIDKSSMVAVWLFDEGSGQIANDSSENGNDAEFQGQPKWIDGKFGKALWFNGSTDYIAAPDSESLDINTDQLSIVAWINGEGWPAANHVVRKVADGDTSAVYILRVQPETVRIYLNTGGGDEITDGTTVLPVNEWIHVAMIYDSEEVRVYVNGELDGNKPQVGEVRQSNNELRIGRGEPAGYFFGSIDEVAIFSSALTEEDIRDIMKTGLGMILPVESVGKLSIAWAEVKIAY